MEVSLSDLGNARLMVSLYAAELRWDPAAKLWLRWDDQKKQWSPSYADEGSRYACRLAGIYHDEAARVRALASAEQDQAKRAPLTTQADVLLAWARKCEGIRTISAAARLYKTQPEVQLASADPAGDRYLEAHEFARAFLAGFIVRGPGVRVRAGVLSSRYFRECKARNARPLHVRKFVEAVRAIPGVREYMSKGYSWYQGIGLLSEQQSQAEAAE